MQLESLIYLSTAAHSPTPAEIEHLLDRARLWNMNEQVTGVLLYSGGSFLQCLEGAGGALDKVMIRIRADPLHHHILEILREPIHQREFADWSMAYRSTNARGSLTADVDPLSERLTAPTGSSSPVRRVLSAFWNGGLGSRYVAPIEWH